MGASSDRETLDLEGQRALARVLRGLGGTAEPIRVGRYVLGELIGSGAFGQVFVARDPELDREVAIKLVARRLGSEASQSRLLREGQALAKLQHPHVVPVYDVGVGELGASRRRGLYIVMERVRGRTLAAWQAEPERTPAEIVAAYDEAARGLAAAHAAGVVHRDFKPANAMVTPSGAVVVIDFGLATAPGDHSGGPVSSDLPEGSSGSGGGSLTETGTVMGTPRYMAPEQHRAEPATPATDQYAWCVALWEALTGSPPFVAARYDELAAAKTRGELPAASRIPAELRRVLARGLCPDPMRRFASMTELLAELERAPRRRRRRVLALAAAAGAAVAVAVAVAPEPRPSICDDASPRPASRIATDGPGLEARPHLAMLAASDPALTRQERFVAAWHEARDEVCAEAGTSQATIRGACLSRAKVAYEQARAVLDEPPTAGAPWILELWTLRSPRHCAGADAETAFVVRDPLPEEAAVRAELEHLVFEVPIPPPPNMQATIDRARAIAEQTGDPMLGAVARLVAARGHLLAHDRVKAADVAVEAAWEAQTAGDELFATEILVEGLALAIAPGTPPDDVDRLVRSARELARAAADPPVLVASLDRMHADALHLRGDLEGALAAYDDLAARLRAASDPALGPTRINALGQRGDILWALGRPWAARRAYQEAIASVTVRDADGLRAYVDDLHARLAAVSILAGDLDTAAAASLEALHAASDPRTGRARAVGTLGLYGWILALRGHPQEGRAHLNAAIAELRSLGDRRLGDVLHDLARVDTLDDRPADAIERVEELRALAADDPFADPSTVPAAWAWLAVLNVRVGDLERATAALSRAEEIVAREQQAARAGTFDPAHVDLPAARAEVALAQGDFATARDQILVALDDPDLHDGTPLARGDLGDRYAILSRALYGLGERDAAADVATLAQEAYAGADALRRRLRLPGPPSR